MSNSEFVNVRGQNLMASSVWAGGQEFLIIAIPSDRQDSATAEIYAQQNIEIVPGLKIQNKKSGKEFEILSKPSGFMKHIKIKETRRNIIPEPITEDELRQNYRFMG
ncbi:hypothetical protein QUA62_26640 [Microcoleus sp. MON1_C1]|uniref:hypothetical protein n=1 Tax=Microcoleus sp. MON1_C1 TaxID=2818827 RepID=UPI002FD75967